MDFFIESIIVLYGRNSELPDSNDLLSNGLSRIFGGLPEDILM